MAILSSVVNRRSSNLSNKKILTILAVVAAITIFLTGGDLRRLSLIGGETETTKVEKHAVAILVSDDATDLNDLKFNLRALRTNEIIQPETPILIFHEDGFPIDKKWEIMLWTLNPISFHMVDFTLPEGFVAETEDDWSYQLVQRFWISGIWRHAVVRQFDTIMRLDTDSCFVSEGKDVEDLMLPAIRGRYVYRGSALSTGVAVGIDGLYDFMIEYIEANKLTIGHPELWERVKNMWDEEKTLPVFDTSFEVNRVNFYMRREVAQFVETVTESAPYGIFNKNWGDAQIRVLVMAIFGTKDSLEDNILMKTHPGYKHGSEICEEHFAPAVKSS